MPWWAHSTATTTPNDQIIIVVPDCKQAKTHTPPSVRIPFLISCICLMLHGYLCPHALSVYIFPIQPRNIYCNKTRRFERFGNKTNQRELHGRVVTHSLGAFMRNHRSPAWRILFFTPNKKNKTTYQYSYADISLPDRNGFCRTMNTWAASGTISFPVGMGCVVFHVICHCELRIVHFGTRELCKEFYLCAILVNLCDLHQTIWINRESH